MYLLTSLKNISASVAGTTVLNWPKYAAPFLLSSVATITIMTTIVAVKIFKSYNSNPVNCERINLIVYQKNHPLVPLLGLIFCAAAAMLPLPLGMLSVVPMGIYAGFHIERKMTVRYQELHAGGSHLREPNKQIALR